MLHEKETKMQTGTIIKAYDFHGNTNHYMVGRVIKVQDEIIMAETIKRVVDGQEAKNFSPTFSAPVNGAHFMDNGKFTRIHVIG